MLGKGRSGIRIPEMGQKGFTLIELLIVVAILGSLAAIVIPNVGRFIGQGEAEAKGTEFANIQTAVVAMMVDNALGSLPRPVDTIPTNDMTMFPDISVCEGDKLSDYKGDPFTFLADRDGYILYGHDRIADGKEEDLVNYVTTANTSYWYTVDTQGTVTQHLTPPP